MSRWSESEDTALREFRSMAPPMSFQLIGVRLGRSGDSALRRWRRLTRAEQKPNQRGCCVHECQVTMVHVPPEVLAERDRRLSIVPPLACVLHGDPLPGYSALDRRVGT